jgi:hypothetical protein
MNLNIFAVFYLLFLSFGRCRDLKRSTGFISLALSNVKVLATSMNNRTKRDNQSERNKEQKPKSKSEEEQFRISFLDLLACTMIIIFLTPFIFLFNWIFIGIGFLKLTGIIICFYIILATVAVISNPKHFTLISND